MAAISTAEDAGALWLTTLQRALARASHDVKDALNGVSVNLEVIRSRAARPDAPAAAVAQFAEAAAQQLERLTSLLEAVLALGRAEREPADVRIALGRIATLCSASNSAGAPVVEVRAAGDVGATTTRVRSDAVRLALAAPLLDLVAAPRPGAATEPVVCTLSADGEDVVVSISGSGVRAAMPDAIADVVRAAGIRWSDDEQGKTTRAEDDFSLVFPRA